MQLWRPFVRLDKLGRATFRSQAVLDSPYTLCGSEVDVEMHHVRALKDVSKQPKDYMTAMMSRMNRKQIPVCRPCHIRIHQSQRLISR